MGGEGLAGVCGAAVVGGVMTWGVEVPVTLPMPLAAWAAIGAARAIKNAPHLRTLLVIVESPISAC
jgi:hypothetical protein